jgi:hypothetical protein
VSLGCSNRLSVEFELVPGQSIAKHGGDLTLKALNHAGPELDYPVVCNVDQMIFVLVPDRSVAGRTPPKRVALDQPRLG